MKGIESASDLRLYTFLAFATFPVAAVSQERLDTPDFDYGEFGVVFEDPVERDGYLSFGAIGRLCFESVVMRNRRFLRACMPFSRISCSTRFLPTRHPWARRSWSTRGLP